MGKGTFIIYDADLKGLDFLTDTQAGKLFKALAKFRLEGVEQKPGNNAAVNILFQQMLEHIAINEDKYREICKRNSESAKKRWHGMTQVGAEKKSSPMPAYALACDGIQKDASPCVYDNDNDNDNDNDIDNENENENDACGAKRENKRKNYYGKKQPFAYEGEPSYDIEAFTRKTIGLKYEKK